MATTKMITTLNPDWGFHGTISTSGKPGTAAALYDRAARAVMKAHGLDAVKAVALLDAPAGRHMADGIVGRNESIATVVSARWVARAIRELDSDYVDAVRRAIAHGHSSL